MAAVKRRAEHCLEVRQGLDEPARQHAAYGRLVAHDDVLGTHLSGDQGTSPLGSRIIKVYKHQAWHPARGVSAVQVGGDSGVLPGQHDDGIGHGVHHGGFIAHPYAGDI